MHVTSSTFRFSDSSTGHCLVRATDWAQAVAYLPSRGCLLLAVDCSARCLVCSIRHCTAFSTTRCHGGPCWEAVRDKWADRETSVERDANVRALLISHRLIHNVHESVLRHLPDRLVSCSSNSRVACLLQSAASSLLFFKASHNIVVHTQSEFAS